MTMPLPDALNRFLEEHALSLDTDASQASALLPALGASGLLKHGVPLALGGEGGYTIDALDAITAVAEKSLAAAFVFWGQRAFIEYLLQSPNEALRERWLAPLLKGESAGATGLSNAMKFLSGIESLQVQASTVANPFAPGHFLLDGQVPWATNLRPQGFVVAAAVERRDGEAPFIAALPFDRAGLQRSDDLDLIALRGTHTAALRLTRLEIEPQDVIAIDARAWLPRVRPAFLVLQCGLSIGLAQASLAAAQQHGAAARKVLGEPIQQTQAELAVTVATLREGLYTGQFVTDPVPLFQSRIRLAHLALQAVQLELQSCGGRAYHRDQPLGFARRWREAAFLPIVTPSLTQLQGELNKRAAKAAVTA
jgi:alkylation response protein AidB-like acyl-CoA dehydrogenase